MISSLEILSNTNLLPDNKFDYFKMPPLSGGIYFLTPLTEVALRQLEAAVEVVP
jgi:hypothetical protein